MRRSTKAITGKFFTLLALTIFVAQLRFPAEAQEMAPTAAPAAAASEGRSPVEVWVPGKVYDQKADPLTWLIKGKEEPLAKQQVLNRMRLFAQNAKWENLEKLSAGAVTYEDKDLLAFGHFYRALLAGRAFTAEQPQKLDEAMDNLRVALKFGYRNPDDILAAEPLLPLQEREDFTTLIRELTERLDREMRERFAAYVNASLDVEKFPAKPWKPDLKTASGEPFFEAGAPALAILTRTNHDGFPKTLRVLQAVRQARGPKFPLGVIFYQYDAADPTGLRIARDYVESLGLDVPWAMIGREGYKQLVAGLNERDALVKPFLKKQAQVQDPDDPSFLVSAFNYFPITAFFDGTGAPILALEAVPEAWQAEYAIARFEETVAATGESTEGSAPEEAPPSESQ